MHVQKRKVSTKRHTLGWKVGNRWRSREEAYSLASQGRITNVAAYRRGRTKYIQALPGTQRLYDLPVTVA